MPLLALDIAGGLAFAGALIWLLAVRPLERAKRRLEHERALLETLAHEDPLTGLPNKRGFDDRLDNELRRAVREYYTVAVVVLDLDRFKQINDSWGHAVGDEALAKLADHLKAELRAGDFAGRIGGDEFVLALVRADALTAERILGRIHESVQRTSIGPAHERLDFSAGIAEFPRHAKAREELLHCADEALYWGKANGRGRAAVFSPGTADARSPERSAEAARRRTLLSTLQALAREVDSKSRWTLGHSERVASYAVAIARELELPEERVDAIRRAALLHDVGKIGIKESILTKEEALNLDELEELQRHSELSRAMLAGAGFPEIARWVHHLHERFDGDGYPAGLAGREIPEESRILHAADALDQMTRPSALRRSRPLREALAELSYCAGTRIDPEIAARLIALVEKGEIKVAAADDPAARARRSLATRR